MKDLILVGIGSLIGGVSRYYLGGLILHAFISHKFPYATCFINILGCFIIGIFAGFAEHGILPQNLRLFFMTGILGGFTTFSAFGYETIFLFRNQQSEIAILYILASVILGICSVFLGLKISNFFI